MHGNMKFPSIRGRSSLANMANDSKVEERKMGATRSLIGKVCWCFILTRLLHGMALEVGIGSDTSCLDV